MFGHCECKCAWDFHGAEAPMSQNAFLSQDAFKSLSEEDKNRVLSDIYGVGADMVEETSEMVAQKIRQVREALDRIQIHKKTSYMMALAEEHKQGTQYVRSSGLLLMFLRAECFNVSAAAKRIVKHFDHKMKLFGSEMLPRRITQHDLSEDDKEFLFSGYIHINCGMDHVGRTIMVIDASRLRYKNPRNLFRGIFYYSMAALENKEKAQRMGLGIILYCVDYRVNQAQRKELVMIARELSFVGSAPYRIACLHHCEAKNHFTLFAMFMLSMYSVKIKARYIHHNGSHGEIHSKLLHYGIRVDLLPTTAFGKFDEATFLEPLRKKQKDEYSRICGGNVNTSCLCNGDDDMSIGSY